MEQILVTLDPVWAFLKSIFEPASLIVELGVIVLGLHEWRERKRLEVRLAQKLGDSNGVLERYAGAVQMSKAHPAISGEEDLLRQLNDLGGYYQAWKKRNNLPTPDKTVQEPQGKK
jgi:hypothetical protein